MFDVVCVGNLVADAIANPVKTIPAKGKLELVDKISLFTGGCAANSAVDMTKIGLNVSIIGLLGDDGFGGFMRSSLQEQGLNITGVKTKENSSTSASLVMISPDGERSFIHSVGANGSFLEKDIDYSIIEQTDIVFVAGFMLMPAFDGEECANFLKKCKQMGKTTILDTAWDSTGKWMKLLKPSMQYIDYFLPSLDEAQQLSGREDSVEIADYFLELGPKVVAIKLGKDGCLIKTKAGQQIFVPAFTGIKAVDTTGAGDSFCAGFITGLVRGWDLYNCGLFANAVGAHCVMAAGASSGIKSQGEILDFIDKHKTNK